ncbi:hypothetical protein BP6252_00951 [Coleophoma cylindrospora]|uniref:AB hydrolase-1 domain-containing protein n=1 Tax=Coleophoma cylindrospora TaxID=1849047 RepID=A0A3D8SRH7_9HELO|nr:hypothetical protein BP6252_00951 [Coleophoma cylindrospora]
MFEGFTEFNIPVEPDVTIHGIQSELSGASSKPALLLLHGFPQTLHIWHRVAPSLTDHFVVIALDLRGYGQSSKPHTDGDTSHQKYAKSTAAHDCIRVMDALGFTGAFALCAHDRGARVAHKLSVDFPARVRKLLLLDIAPTLATFQQAGAAMAQKYWHWFFLIQDAPFPERAMLSNPELFVQKFFGGASYAGAQGSAIFDAQALRIYAAQFSQEDCLHGMCEDYRAAATIDLVEAQRDLDAGRKVKCDVRVLWGNKGIWATNELLDLMKEWRLVVDGDVSGAATDSGHYIPEEAPQDVIRHIKEFLV